MEVAVHPEAAAFERAIYDRPGDATPRLVYADWLDDRDDSEFAAWLRTDPSGLIGSFKQQRVPIRSLWRLTVQLRAMNDAYRLSAKVMVEAFEKAAEAMRDWSAQVASVFNSTSEQTETI